VPDRRGKRGETRSLADNPTRPPTWHRADRDHAVEWPFGGIGLTIMELDGAAIVAAARRSAYYWPETDQGNQP